MDIYIVELKSADNIEQDLLNKFCHKEFSNKKKQKEHSFAYLILDRILKEVYKTENRELEFKDGKPSLLNNTKQISLSHSGDYIALAISDFPCGIDVEKIKPRDFEKISKRMNFHSNSLEEFYKNWTEYEAEFKLGSLCLSKKFFEVQNHVISAVSSNPDEAFEIFIQTSDNFNNLTN